MKNKILFCLVLVGLMCISIDHVLAQVSINNVMGTKISNSEGYEGVEGSPFFYAEWLEGNVIFASGEDANIEFLKYDMFTDRLLFSDNKKTAEFSFSKPVNAFVLRGAVFQRNFPKIGNFDLNSYFQVIAKGKISLLKKEEVVIGERTAVGVPAVKYFKKMLKYFIFDGEVMKVVKPDVKSLSAYFGVSAHVVDQFVKENKLVLKRDEDLKLLFNTFAK